MTMVWDLFGTPANSTVPDADGNVWTVASSEGWDAPDQRTQLMSPTGLHGQRILNPYAEGRSVVLEGLVLAPSEAAAWKAYDRLTSAMPGLGGSGDIVAYEPVPKSLTVVQAGPPRVSKPLGGTISYRLTLLAEYPWKRALSQGTEAIAAGGTGVLTATGTFPAAFEVTLTSGGTVDLVIGTRHFTTTALPSGAVIDMGARTITAADGSSLYGAKTAASEWLALPPGTTTIEQDGTAALDLTWHDTYA